MTKSKHYNTVKKNYDEHFWSLKKVRNAVKSGWITEEEFEEITGMAY